MSKEEAREQEYIRQLKWIGSQMRMLRNQQDALLIRIAVEEPAMRDRLQKAKW